MNIVGLMECYLVELFILQLSNWMSAPAAAKTTQTTATLVHHQINRIGITKDEPMAPAA